MALAATLSWFVMSNELILGTLGTCMQFFCVLLLCDLSLIGRQFRTALAPAKHVNEMCQFVDKLNYRRWSCIIL